MISDQEAFEKRFEHQKGAQFLKLENDSQSMRKSLAEYFWHEGVAHGEHVDELTMSLIEKELQSVKDDLKWALEKLSIVSFRIGHRGSNAEDRQHDDWWNQSEELKKKY